MGPLCLRNAQPSKPSDSTSEFFPKKKQFSGHLTRESESNQQLVRQPTFFKWKRLTGWCTSSYVRASEYNY
jgi:hypothetical protein